MKKVLVVCGTGGITSAIAEKEIQTAARREGLHVQTIRCTPGEVALRAGDVDLIVSTTAIGNRFPVPVINGMPLVTGVGKAQVIDDIVGRLKETK